MCRHAGESFCVAELAHLAVFCHNYLYNFLHLQDANEWSTALPAINMIRRYLKWKRRDRSL